MAPARPSRSGASSKGASPAAGKGQRPTGALAFRSPRAVTLFLVCAVAGAAGDLWSKAWAFRTLAGRGLRTVIVPGYLNLTLSTNPGIVFGLPVPGWIVQIATLVAMAAVALLFVGSARKFWGLHAALGMVLGGAAGNLYDRVFVKVALPGQPMVTGHVRDFIDVTIPLINYKWPVFNVADALLVVGLGMILLHLFRHGREGSK